jgi:cobalt/nickel transport protein
MRKSSKRGLAGGGLLLAVGIAILLSPFASNSPDGLERVAQDKGFTEKETSHLAFQAPIQNYAIPGVKSGWLSTPMAGGIGTVLTFGLVYGIAQTLAWRRKRNSDR